MDDSLLENYQYVKKDKTELMMEDCVVRVIIQQDSLQLVKVIQTSTCSGEASRI